MGMEIKPEVIYQDEAILVLNKPSGMSVHSDGKHAYPTVVEWLLKHYPEIAGVGEPQTLPNGELIDRPGVVHRLDRETSGVLVVARTQEVFLALKEQFKERDALKVYRAFVHGNIKDDRGIINKPIGSSRGGVGPRSARAGYGTMREALTTYRTISRSPGASYVEVFPKTGRTHQIRVHFSAVQHPVVGDRLYGPGRPPLLGFTRLALHAFSLGINHPLTGARMTFTAPLPEDFLAAENSLGEQLREN